jgi:hypothetical protein
MDWMFRIWLNTDSKIVYFSLHPVYYTMLVMESYICVSNVFGYFQNIYCINGIVYLFSHHQPNQPKERYILIFLKYILH